MSESPRPTPADLMPSNKDPPTCALLRLPTEIRNEIYRYLLSSEYIKCKIPYPGRRFETTYYTYPFHKQILCTNRQVYREAIHIFRTENLFFRFTTNHPNVGHILWESQGLLLLTHGIRAGSFRHRAMDVIHYCPRSGTTGDHKNCDCAELDFKTCLFVSDQLPNLLRTLRAYSQQGDRRLAQSSFAVSVFDDFDQWSTEAQPGTSYVCPRIRNLLDPFELLYDVDDLDIQGSVNDHYRQSIVASATQREPKVAKIVTTASAFQKQGDEAFRNHNFELSLSLYTSAISEVQVNHHWAEYTGFVTTGQYAGMSTPHAVRRFKIRIHSDMAGALVKVGEYRRATDHAKEAIKQRNTRESPPEEWEGLYLTITDCAKPYLWGGLAYEGLGDLNRAIYGVGEALFYYPGNKRLEREYKRLELEIEKQGIVPTEHAFGKGTNWWVRPLVVRNQRR